tara:strand:- start:3424 stop:5742 length:2319 start_codon:yes stop_codon:yes gene_type:complete
MRQKKAYTPARKTLLAVAVTTVTTPVLAQMQLEEIIVTAQKRTELVQDISATVNVVTGDAIERFSALSFIDLEQQTAGVTLSAPNARNSNISMRGISIDPEAGAASAVDVYWNSGIVRADNAFTLLYDLERVEILRGPQGTLQGATSPAGAINIITRRPDLFETNGYVQMTVGDNDGLNTQAAWTGPLIEGKLGVRVAGVYDTNNSSDVNNITSGLDDPEAEAKSGRLTANWLPSDDLDVTLVWQYLDRYIEDSKAVSGVDSLGERPTLNDDDRIALGKYNNFGEIKYDLANLLVNWTVGDLELASVTAYQNSDKPAGTENDRAHYVTNPEALTHQNTLTAVESYSQEFRLSSSGNDFWDYIVGVYYNEQNTTTQFSSNTTLTDGLEISFLSSGVLPVNGKELAAFTFNTFYLTDALQLEVGLRWTDYDRFRASTIDYDSLNYLPPALAPVAGLVEQGIAAAFPIEGVSERNQSADETAVTGSVKLRYALNDDVSVYGAYNRGYRPSGISITPSPNVVFLPNGEDDLLHDEETSDAIEVGFKSRLLDGRATLNGAVYYQQFDGYIGFTRGIQVLDDSGAPADIVGGFIFNGDATTYGVEFDGRLLITEQWVTGASFSYAKGEWDDGATKPCNQREPDEVLGSCDIKGDPIGGEPELSLSLNSEYTWPLESTEVYLRGLYKFTDERLNTEASAGIGAVRESFDSYSIFNLYAGWRSADASWDVSVFAKNLLDDETVNYQQGPDQYDLALSGGSYTQINLVPQRTFGVTARYNF